MYGTNRGSGYHSGVPNNLQISVKLDTLPKGQNFASFLETSWIHGWNIWKTMAASKPRKSQFDPFTQFETRLCITIERARQKGFVTGQWSTWICTFSFLKCTVCIYVTKSLEVSQFFLRFIFHKLSVQAKYLMEKKNRAKKNKNLTTRKKLKHDFYCDILVPDLWLFFLFQRFANLLILFCCFKAFRLLRQCNGLGWVSV